MMQARGMAWKTILVPHDFSASANHATAIARDEAKEALMNASSVMANLLRLRLDEARATAADHDADDQTVRPRTVRRSLSAGGP